MAFRNDYLSITGFPYYQDDIIVHHESERIPNDPKTIWTSLEKTAFESVFREHVRGCIILCEKLAHTRHFPKSVIFTCRSGFKGQTRTLTLDCGAQISYLDLGKGKITAPTFAALPLKFGRSTFERNVRLPTTDGNNIELHRYRKGIAVDKITARKITNPGKSLGRYLLIAQNYRIPADFDS